jgi:hypothetical protein
MGSTSVIGPRVAGRDVEVRGHAENREFERGILETTHRNSKRYEHRITARTTIIIQGNMSASCR